MKGALSVGRAVHELVFDAQAFPVNDSQIVIIFLP